jgi:cell wall-associated NlpC family hydrolase
MIFRFVLPVLMSLLLVQCSSSKKHLYSYDYNSGKTSLLLGDQAVPPANLPEKVMRAITAANRIKDKPYRRGGGHAKIEDTAYDCSGSVSYVLHHAGLLDSPLPSSGFRKYGKKGEGEWITV